MSRPATPFGCALELAAATVLLAIGSALILLWLLLLLLALSGGIEPRNAAGAPMFGLIFVGLAALPGGLGVAWLRYLGRHAGFPWPRLARVQARLGFGLMAFGAAAALSAAIFAAARAG